MIMKKNSEKKEETKEMKDKKAEDNIIRIKVGDDIIRIKVGG